MQLRFGTYIVDNTTRLAMQKGLGGSNCSPNGICMVAEHSARHWEIGNRGLEQDAIFHHGSRCGRRHHGWILKVLKISLELRSHFGVPSDDVDDVRVKDQSLQTYFYVQGLGIQSLIEELLHNSKFAGVDDHLDRI